MPEDSKGEVKTFAFYLFQFLKDNPQYAKDFVHTICQFFKILAYGLVLSVIIFGILAIQHYL